MGVRVGQASWLHGVDSVIQNSYTWPTLENREASTRKTYKVSLNTYFQNNYSKVTKIINIFAKENLILFFISFRVPTTGSWLSLVHEIGWSQVSSKCQLNLRLQKTNKLDVSFYENRNVSARGFRELLCISIAEFNFNRIKVLTNLLSEMLRVRETFGHVTGYQCECSLDYLQTIFEALFFFVFASMGLEC